MLKPYIKKLTERQDLTEAEMRLAMEIIMTGGASDAQIAAFLTALKMKGETVDEIYAALAVMMEKADKVKLDDKIILDTCGTGGDGANTFNISTAISVIAAAAGITVAKHGNRALTSRSGSADVLKALGVNIELSVQAVKNSIKKTGLAFLFAPGFHKAMKYAGPVRRELGVRTIFNVLGPLANPAKNTHHLMGVYSPDLTEKIAGVLQKSGNVHSLVVCGAGNTDEVALWGETKVTELKAGMIKTYTIKPEDFGMTRRGIQEVAGGTPEENAAIMRGIFDGTRKDAYRDAVVLNAGCALYAADRTGTVKEGIELAAMVIDKGLAQKKLHELIQCSNEPQTEV